MANNYFVSGQWNAICDSCGKRYKISELKKRWDGLLVCEKDYELDHPQKYLRVRETGQAVPIIRDEPQDEFKNVCDFAGISGYASWAVAGCAVAGNAIDIDLLISLYDLNAVAGYCVADNNFCNLPRDRFIYF